MTQINFPSDSDDEIAHKTRPSNSNGALDLRKSPSQNENRVLRSSCKAPSHEENFCHPKNDKAVVGVSYDVIGTSDDVVNYGLVHAPRYSDADDEIDEVTHRRCSLMSGKMSSKLVELRNRYVSHNLFDDPIPSVASSEEFDPSNYDQVTTSLGYVNDKTPDINNDVGSYSDGHDRVTNWLLDVDNRDTESEGLGRRRTETSSESGLFMACKSSQKGQSTPELNESGKENLQQTAEPQTEPVFVNENINSRVPPSLRYKICFEVIQMTNLEPVLTPKHLYTMQKIIYVR